MIIRRATLVFTVRGKHRQAKDLVGSATEEILREELATVAVDHMAANHGANPLISSTPTNPPIAAIADLTAGNAPIKENHRVSVMKNHRGPRIWRKSHPILAAFAMAEPRE